MAVRPFRFGAVAAQAECGAEWLEKVKDIEDLGYDTLVVPDGLNYVLSPFTALAMAAATTRLRIGTYVLANDYRHPVMLAKEAATLAVLSNGRFELGIGAGRPSAAADNAMLGLAFDSGGTRVTRLAESLAIVKPLLRGEKVSFAGSHYAIQDAQISPFPDQPPVILVAGSGRRLLTLAARYADAIALGVDPDATEAQLAERISWIRDAAAERFDSIELNLNLMAVAGKVPGYLRMTMGDGALRLAESDAIPVLKGTIEQTCDRLEWLRDRFGISYIMVSDELMGALSPVVKRLSGR